MSEQKPVSKKVIIAIGFNGALIPPRAKVLIGGKKFTTFPMFRKIAGCDHFVCGDIPSFVSPNGAIHNPATAKDDKDELIIKEWRKDGDLMIGEI